LLIALVLAGRERIGAGIARLLSRRGHRGAT
jgi:hypothetical protein